ncbi:D-alanyl-D-alanine carboxypeptidase [Streptococcus chenjunshii]|uniref:serine-type D-Ala-D-Ala carboxypeptidase n=1 Tax=Streptococcus chenjunshii TaxID=2173853 RepID=A0A372KMW3_9STRE|nr:D-alanyl-D-alanine carboxypeptidase PBP3 [Streptococcus chenjunshii]AXQ79354.1 D-alanyl-D-alanine carboxypeptidase [Streptococcus chenjunshii]RFU50590.1 D-alanyl-D-alanine carboxypeptidase [Streptococcus chenjunshii]RFU52918.1 D-alanyl-D-alanine carboxypeptidase [Streptococcus chenjunshii]
MKKLLGFIFILLSLWGGAVRADDFEAEAEHALAVEVSTGKILYEKDAATPDGIASMTKILTVYLVYKEIDQGHLSWDSKVPISDYAYDLTANSDASNVPMEDREYTVEQLVNAALIASANSAAIALAEHIAGSETAFVDMMQAQLQEWGIYDASLVNASGLNNSYLGEHIYPDSDANAENQMSALDIAIIARHLITEYPDVLNITQKTSAVFAGTAINTYNYMLPDMPYAREGVDGLKTGTTEAAGPCFVATSTENGMRIISVVMNAEAGEGNDYARFEVTNNILNYVQDNFELTTLLAAGESYRDSEGVVLDGKAKTVAAVAKSDLKVVQKKSADQAGSLSLDINTSTAPVRKGQTIGTATFSDGNIIGSGYLQAPPNIELVTKNEVERSFFLKVWWNHFVNYVNEKL